MEKVHDCYDGEPKPCYPIWLFFYGGIAQCQNRLLCVQYLIYGAMPRTHRNILCFIEKWPREGIMDTWSKHLANKFNDGTSGLKNIKDILEVYCKCM